MNKKKKSAKAVAALLFAKAVKKDIRRWSAQPEKTQQKTFKSLIQAARNTAFGREHRFKSIKSYEHFSKNVPIRDYEGLKPWITKVLKGEPNVLWRGKPLYFAKTSGTTSGAKHIPITKASMPSHIKAARNALLCYIAETGRSEFVTGKMIFLQGSPVLKERNGIKIGRLSGIVAYHVPAYLQKNRLPSWETNCIDDWETKVNAIVEETCHKNMTVISGIPSWVQMYFEKLKQKTKKPIGELFKNLELFIYGGLNYEPYRAGFEQIIGRSVAGIELFPASEGFFAFQDSQKATGMLLQLNSGIFYEFVKADEFGSPDVHRLTIGQVELGVNYVLIISSNAGLWAYNTGDLVQFTSLKPYRVIVSGRLKHFISAFGEHVIAQEVEKAMQEALKQSNCSIREFTVAPFVNSENSAASYHEWLIEFEKPPAEPGNFASYLDQFMQKQNSYYADLRQGNLLAPPKITFVKKEGFKNYMISIGKFGGQNKVQRLSNDRKLANALGPWIYNN